MCVLCISVCLHLDHPTIPKDKRAKIQKEKLKFGCQRTNREGNGICWQSVRQGLYVKISLLKTTFLPQSLSNQFYPFFSSVWLCTSKRISTFKELMTEIPLRKSPCFGSFVHQKSRIIHPCRPSVLSRGVHFFRVKIWNRTQ